MKLIEKKCPNCGATLEFNETDKSCKCNYCKRSFEIERDTDNLDKFNLIYDKMYGNLETIQKPFKFFFLIPIVFFIIIFLIILFNVFHFQTKTKSTDSGERNSITSNEISAQDSEKLITNVSELSNSDFDSIDNHAKGEINHSGEGINNANHSYSINGKIKREKLYVAYKEGSNYIIPVYKATYYDFFHQENQYTVYIPILFENIESNVIFSLGNPTLKAPEYYFNSEKTSYTYGYGSMDDVYNEVIVPLKTDYQISEK